VRCVSLRACLTNTCTHTQHRRWPIGSRVCSCRWCWASRCSRSVRGTRCA
jgi:hypothetical protein